MRSDGASVPTRVAVLAGIVLLPFVSLALGTAMLVPLFLMPALFVIPAMLYRGDGGPPPDRPDGEDGGGGGPRRPDPPQGLPGAGPPLPDADQARARKRDHARGRLAPARTRRGPSREPARRRVRTARGIDHPVA
jgi:hypothetical protein